MDVSDFLALKLVYILPLTSEQFERFLKTETVFKRKEKLNQDLFIKNFFPQVAKMTTNLIASDSSSDENGETKRKKTNSISSMYGGSSNTGSHRRTTDSKFKVGQTLVAAKVKALE